MATEQINSRADWLAWRKNFIGGSDSPIVMGLSNWCTPLQLWEQKISDEVVEGEENFAMKLGTEAEPKIRGLFELMRGESFEPCLVQSGDFEFIAASLDGRSECKKKIVEIKLLNKADWTTAKETGKIPDKYYCQVQHNLIASQAEVAYFVAYLWQPYKENRKGPLSQEHLVVVDVFPDKKYQGNIIQEESKFWYEHVLKKKPPVATKGDIVELPSLEKHVKWYLELREKHAELSQHLAEAEQTLKLMAEDSGHAQVAAAGLKMQKVSRAGSFSVAKAPEVVKFTKEFADKLTPEERSKYTGKGSVYWKITPPKKEAAE